MLELLRTPLDDTEAELPPEVSIDGPADLVSLLVRSLSP